jgi:hypothetical protein
VGYKVAHYPHPSITFSAIEASSVAQVVISVWRFRIGGNALGIPVKGTWRL